MKVKVTQKHIDNGTRYSSLSCPIALAIQEGNPQLQNVSVGLYTTSCHAGTTSLPVEAIDFIRAFDDGLTPIKPFEFELDDYNPQLSKGE